MEIVKEGKTKIKWSRDVTCTGNGNACTDGCGAVLKVVREDLRYYNGSSGYFLRSNAVSFICPCCSGITDLKITDWPTNAPDLRGFTTAWRDGRETPFEEVS